MFFHREGPENETSTNDIVSKMTNFIKENSFELTFDGMNIKFTSLQVSGSALCPPGLTDIQERNIYNESQLYDWCKDGDLQSFATGEFDVFTSSGEE